MSHASEPIAGRLVALRRYPVKSMMGEELNACEVTERGVLGDRAFALLDASTGKVVSAKNPRKWPRKFEHQATYLEPPSASQAASPVRITFPDGSQVMTSQPDAESRLSASVGRPVRLASSVPAAPGAEGYWPDEQWLPHPAQEFEFPLPPGTFFDMATIHLLTTATLTHLQSLVPNSRFEARRFRPNFVIEVPDNSLGFVENEWLGRILRLGDQVRVRVEKPCPRCIMTTLPQADLPSDPNILRAAVEHNQANVGVYASVIQGGKVQRGDTLTIDWLQ